MALTKVDKASLLVQVLYLETELQEALKKLYDNDMHGAYRFKGQLYRVAKRNDQFFLQRR